MALANSNDKVLTTSVPSRATASQRARRPAIKCCSLGVNMFTSSYTSRPASRLGSNLSGKTDNSPRNTMIQLANKTWRAVKMGIQPQRRTA
ncbi:hypothetical protein D9M71_49180 [compost metagenome]